MLELDRRESATSTGCATRLRCDASNAVAVTRAGSRVGPFGEVSFRVRVPPDRLV